MHLSDVTRYHISTKFLNVSAYDGPQSYELQNSDNSSTTKIQVLQVTSEHSTTEDLDDNVDEIPTINTGRNFLYSSRIFPS